MRHPVVLTVYNRPDHTRQVLNALRQHRREPLYVFCDGPKGDHDDAAVWAVRELIAAEVDWTRPYVVEAEANWGLAASVVAAVDRVLAEHETMILLEDDIIPGPHFFSFVTACLDRYADDGRVFGVTGYTVPVPKQMRDAHPWDSYFFPRPGSWGWGTWRRAWAHYERDFAAAYQRAKRQGANLAAGGADVPNLIESAIRGRLDAWTPGWLLALALNDGLFCYPTVSHVVNIGFDGTGVHCGRTTRYDSPLAALAPTRLPPGPVESAPIAANFRRYY